MKFSGEDLKKALVALSFGLEPIIFAVVGWYVGPHLNLTNVTGALIGVVVGFGVMFWRIWKFSLTLGSKVAYDPERGDLRSLASFIEVERYKIVGKDELVKIMGVQTPLQLLTVLKGLSLVSPDLYDLDKLDQVLDEMTDFSKTLSEVRTRSPINFLRVLNHFSDFLALLCVNFALRYEVGGDCLAKGYVVPPFKYEGGARGLLREDLKYYIAEGEVRELYPEALKECLTIGSRAPMLALAAYSLFKMGEEVEASGYGQACSKEMEGLALELLSIAVNDLMAEKKESKVVKAIEQKRKLVKPPASERRAFRKEEEVLRSFINNAYKALMSSSRVPFTARAVLSYLFVKWSEKVSLKLAFMAANNEIAAREAFASLLVPC
jgi:hypothetical protein